MAERETARERLAVLLRERAVMRGDFVLTSGQRSSYYLDARVVSLSSEGSALIGEVFLAALESTPIDAVAGLTMGADPIISAIVTIAGMWGRRLDGLIVRKAAKEHGAARRIEGPWRTGLRVAVVDDTLTTGSSALEAARAVEQDGGIVCGIWALIDREEGARQRIDQAKYPFHALYLASELVVPELG